MPIHVICIEETQLAYDAFDATFTELFNAYFPPIKKKFNKRFHKIEPWMTKGLLTSRRTKIKLNSLSIRQPSTENVNKFKQFRNLYNYVIRAAKKLYYHNRFSALKTNLLKTWQTLYSLISKSKKKC